MGSKGRGALPPLRKDQIAVPAIEPSLCARAGIDPDDMAASVMSNSEAENRYIAMKAVFASLSHSMSDIERVWQAYRSVAEKAGEADAHLHLVWKIFFGPRGVNANMPQ